MGRRPPVYVAGKVRVQAERCSTCIFHAGNRMGLRRGRVKGMVEKCRADGGTIVCHQTLSDDVGAICRGFYDGYADEIPALRLARHMGVVELV